MVQELYVSDLDGTLLNSNQELSDTTVTVVNHLIKNHGMCFSVATARSQHSAWPLIKRLELNQPVVFHNGAFVYDPVARVNVRENYLDSSLLSGLVEEILSHGTHPIVYTADAKKGDRVFYSGIRNPGERDYIQLRLDQQDERFALIGSWDAVRAERVVTIIVIDEQEKIDRLHRVMEDHTALCIHKTRDIYSGYYWLELSSRGSNKHDALCHVQSMLGATTTIGFGDNLNDLPLFAASDLRVAVANAHPELKSHAQVLIGSNDDDGVANYLYHRLRGKPLPARLADID